MELELSDDSLTLLDVLRDQLDITSPKNGCQPQAQCGCCTVLIDGRTARSCLTLAAQTHGKEIATIEGLSASGVLAPLQQAFLARNAAQCGFCTPGMLITSHELIMRGEPVSREEIRDYISGNMCRCTGYHAIVDAIESLIETRKGV